MAMQRLEARISTEQKEHFLDAATLRGQTLTAFIVEAAQAAADATIERHRVIKLSKAASIQFLEALANPPGPNERLRAAAADYNKFVKTIERR